MKKTFAFWFLAVGLSNPFSLLLYTSSTGYLPSLRAYASEREREIEKEEKAFPSVDLLLARAFLCSWIGTAPEEAVAQGDGAPIPSFLMGSFSPLCQLTLSLLSRVLVTTLEVQRHHGFMPRSVTLPTPWREPRMLFKGFKRSTFDLRGD
jgi:hypothetical protein